MLHYSEQFGEICNIMCTVLTNKPENIEALGSLSFAFNSFFFKKKIKKSEELSKPFYL